MGFKFSLRRSASSSPTPSPTAVKSTDPPPEFICPITGVLMADPVIISSGETFERAAIEACGNLSISPPALSLNLSSPPLLIPNSALRSAILRWCDVAGVPHPVPLSDDIACRLLSSEEESKPHAKSSTELPDVNASPVTSCSSTSEYSSGSSSSSSSEITAPKTLKPKTPEAPLSADPLEAKILAKLKHAQIDEQESGSALASLLEATRESPSRRVALATPRLLSALRGLLLSRSPAVISRTLAIIVNLSLEPSNKIRIVRSGAVPAIIDAMHSSSSSREHAAGALFSLALEEENRTAIGVLGALPPLLRLFCDREEGLRARMEAGMALHYLCLAEMNMAKIARIGGAVKGLMAVVKEGERELMRVAMRVMMGMVESKEGKAAMLDGGAVEMMVELLKKEDEEDDEKEMVVMMMYAMSMGGLRFRGIARRVGAEEVIERAMEGLEGEKREMARMTIRVLRGEERERERNLARILWAETEEEVGEDRRSVSEKLVIRRRRDRDPGDGSDPNSAGL